MRDPKLTAPYQLDKWLSDQSNRNHDGDIMKTMKTWMCLLLLLPAGAVWAAPNPDWTTPLAPFRIADNLYYVGSKDLAS